MLSLFEEKNKLETQITEIDRRLPFIYAKSFIYALDTTTQLVKDLEKEGQLPEPAKNSCKRFLDQFNNYREVRNSLHHIEDRLRGLDKNGNPIPTHLLILGYFRNNKYFGITVSDGPCVEIEISDSDLIQAYSIIDDLIWCFEWLGPGEIHLKRSK